MLVNPHECTLSTTVTGLGGIGAVLSAFEAMLVAIAAPKQLVRQMCVGE